MCPYWSISVLEPFLIGHFRVPSGLCFKTRLGAQPLIWKWFFILMQIKLIFTRKVVHLASVWKWGFLQLGSGILVCLKRFSKDETWIYFSEKNFLLEKDQDTIWNWIAILFFTETAAFIDVTKALTNGFLDDWYSTFNPKFCLLERGVKPLRSPQPELLD